MAELEHLEVRGEALTAEDIPHLYMLTELLDCERCIAFLAAVAQAIDECQKREV